MTLEGEFVEPAYLEQALLLPVDSIILKVIISNYFGGMAFT